MAQLWSLRGLSWRELIKRTCRKSWEDEVFGQAARLAFYFFFALFPALLLVLILLSRLGDDGPDGRAALLGSFAQVLLPDAAALIQTTIKQLNARAVFGAGAIVAGIYATWGSLNGTWAIVTGLNKAYEVQEERPWWHVLYVMFGLTISFSVLYLIALAAVVYGARVENIVGHHAGRPAHFGLLWRGLQWIVIATLLICAFAVLYRFGPNLRDRRWQWSVPGAVVAAALWSASTLVLRVYQEHFSSSRIYGGLNAVAALFLWLYVTGAAIFIGGEANSEIERAASEAGHSDVRRPEERRSGGKSAPGK